MLTEAPQVLDAAQRRLAIRNRSVQVMLLAVLIDAEALKGQVTSGAVVWLDRARQKQRGLHIEVGHAVLHDGQFDRDDAGHLDGAAKGDFAIAL